VTARASCPECGAAAAPGRRSCGSCGFAIVEERARATPRPSPRLLRGVGVAAAGGLAVVLGLLALTGGEDAPAQPDPVPARAAEWQLERFLFSFRDDDSAAVACPREVEYSSPTGCRVRYPSGTVRRIFVRVTPVGTLEVLTP
jgi:hypothetical protein